MAGLALVFLLFSFIVRCEQKENLTINLYADFISDFFQNKDVSRIVLYVCWPVEDKVYVTKQLSRYTSVTYPSAIERNNQKDLWRLHQTMYFKIGIVFDMACYNDTTYLLMKSEYFNSTYVWLVFSGENFDLAINHINRLPLRLDTDMTTIKTDTTYMELYDVYSVGKPKIQPLNVTYIGDWSKKNQNGSWLNFFKNSKIMRRRNINGVTIKAVLLIEHNYDREEIEVYLKNDKYPHLDSGCKLSYHLISLIQDIFNYSVKFIMADSWRGRNDVMGILVDEKADITACSLFLTNERLSIAVPLHNTYLYRSGFIFISKNKDDLANLNFLSPFKYSVWVSMVLITILLMISMFIVIKYSYTSDNVLRLSDFFISIWGIWCQIGTSMPFNSISHRTAFLFFLFNAMIVYNFYTSSILSSLLNYQSKTYTLKDLANSKMKCASFDETYAHEIFNKANTFNNPNFDYFISKLNTEIFYESMEEGLEKIRNESLAFFLEYNTGYYYIENHYDPKEICLLQEIDVDSATGLVMYSPINSEYENMFRVGLVKLRQHGFLDRASKKWIFKKPICQSNVRVNVNLEQVTSYFIILMLGMLLSLIILCIEILWISK